MVSSEWFLFYGSLRRGMSNHGPYQTDLEYHHARWLPGYRMYALPHYPYVVKTGNARHQILVELFRIPSTHVRAQIHEMELSVGYFHDYIEVDGIEAIIYLFRKAGNEPVVESGDWVKFFGKSDVDQH